MRPYFLLTGGTGLLGQYLLRNLWLHDVPVAALVRADEQSSAQERLGAVHRHWEGELKRKLPAPVCLEGEITQPHLGLSPQDRQWIAEHCGSVLHNAASLTFWGKDRTRDPWLSNLTGTENVLHLCRSAGVREFHYVSSAYVCGVRDTRVNESDFDRGQAFRNDYEEAKFEAEKSVRRAAAEHLDRLTVYRPAIILGDAHTGYTATYHNLYSYFQFAAMLFQYHPREADGRYFVDVRFNLTGDETHNFVPVDWVAEAMIEILRRPELHGQTYHLTPQVMTTSRLIYDVMSSYYNFYGAKFAGPDALAAGDLNELEKSFYEYVSRYQTYWAQEPLFDRGNLERALPHLPCPVIDFATMTRLLDFAVKNNWGKKAKKRKASVAS